MGRALAMAGDDADPEAEDIEPVSASGMTGGRSWALTTQGGRSESTTPSLGWSVPIRVPTDYGMVWSRAVKYSSCPRRIQAVPPTP